MALASASLTKKLCAPLRKFIPTYDGSTVLQVHSSTRFPDFAVSRRVGTLTGFLFHIIRRSFLTRTSPLYYGPADVLDTAPCACTRTILKYICASWILTGIARKRNSLCPNFCGPPAKYGCPRAQIEEPMKWELVRINRPCCHECLYKERLQVPTPSWDLQKFRMLRSLKLRCRLNLGPAMRYQPLPLTRHHCSERASAVANSKSKRQVGKYCLHAAH